MEAKIPEERIIMEFRDWQYSNRPVDELVDLKQAIEDGDYGTVAEILKIQNAYDIRIETKDAGWR